MVYVIFPQAGPKSGLNLTSSVISLTREAVFYNIDAGKTIVEKVILKPYPSMKKIFFLILSRGQRQEWFFLSGYAWKSKSLKLYKQIYETINFEIFDRQSFSWWVGPEIFFLSFKSACLNIGKSLKLYKQIYETLKFEMVYRPGLTTRQNNFLAVGGGPKNIFSHLRQQAWRGKSLKLYKQIYETLNFEMVDRPGLTTRQNNFLVVGGAKKYF